MLTKPSPSDWVKAARFYDTEVEETEYVPLARFIREERRALREIVGSLGPDLLVLEFGSGTGRVLLDLISHPRVGQKIGLAIGIDISPSMIAAAREKRDIYRGRNFQKIVFLHLNALAASAVFGGRKIDLASVSRANGNGPELVRAEGRIVPRCKRVVISALNTIGVFDPRRKSAYLREMIRSAGIGGTIVVSSFDRTAFARYAGELYRSVPAIIEYTGTISPFMRNETAELSKPGYYSRWYDHFDLISTLKELGCSEISSRKLAPLGNIILARSKST